MADQNSSLESSGVSAEETTTTTTSITASTSTAVSSSCEAMLWEGWSSHPSSSTPDEASTSNIAFLPELVTPSNSSSRFHHQSDMLCNMLSSFHPLAAHPLTSSDDNNAGFLHLENSVSEATASFGEPSKSSTFLTGIPYPLPKHDDHMPQWRYASPLWPTVPESREVMKWDATPWPGATTIQLFHDEDDTPPLRDVVTSFGHAHPTPKKLETFSPFGTDADVDHHIDMNPLTLHMTQTSSTSWIATSTPDRAPDRAPDTYPEPPCTRSSLQLQNLVRTGRDLQQHPASTESSDQVATVGVSRRQNRRCGDEVRTAPASKRSHVEDELVGAALVWRNRGSSSRHEDCAMAPAAGVRRGLDSSTCRPGTGWSTSGAASASQAMELFAMGPALNTNGMPRARRGSATDPQSVYARHRREKINERLKTLQHLVPNGTKVDIVTMLDEAVHYVQFLQLQVKLLKSDKYWIHATPNVYKGIDLTNQPTRMQGMESNT